MYIPITISRYLSQLQINIDKILLILLLVLLSIIIIAARCFQYTCSLLYSVFVHVDAFYVEIFQVFGQQMNN